MDRDLLRYICMYVRVRHFSDGKEVETGSGILRLDKKTLYHTVIEL